MDVNNLGTSDFSLLGISQNIAYSPGGSFRFDSSGTVLILEYTNLPDDNYRLKLFSGLGQFRDRAGNYLDGEPVWPMPPNQSGNGTAGGNFEVNFSIDTENVPLGGFVPVLPLGSLVYESKAVKTLLTSSSDTDTFTVNLYAPQTITLIAHPNPGLQPTISLLSPGLITLATVTGPGAGQDAILQTVAIDAPGTYIITIAASGSTAGYVSLRAILNGAVEYESHQGSDNDNVATAQNLDNDFVTVGTGSLVAVLGEEVGDQYASSVIGFSSQLGSDGFSASQALGPPDTTGYTLHETAWTPASINTFNEHITVGFAHPVYATGVTIREAWGNGFVTGVEVVDTSGLLHLVWQGTDPSQPGAPVDFRVTWPATPYLVHGVRVVVTQNSFAQNYETIDSIQLHAAVTPDPDFYSFTLAAGDTAALALKGLSGIAPAFSLLDPAGNDLYFTVSRSGSEELWKSDGTTAGTVAVKTISFLTSFAALNNTLYFTTLPDGAGQTLFKSDGTPAGTVPLSSISAGNLVRVGAELFFVGYSAAENFELWKTDGTAEGIVRIKDVQPGAVSSGIANLTIVGSIAYFTADDGVHGTELWRSNGTEVGTVLVTDIAPGSASALVTNLTVAADRLYFTADDGTLGRRLWMAESTASTATLVEDAGAASSALVPFNIRASQDKVWFTRVNPLGPIQLWQSDGTASGTAYLRDIAPATRSSFPLNATQVGETIYFTADDEIFGTELWKTDGTAAGTRLVKDIRPGGLGSQPGALTNLNGTLYFTASDSIHGTELWKSDGTEAGTVLVRDIASGPTSSFPATLTPASGRLFFNAYTVSAGSELWVSDGTEQGTMLVKEVQPGTSIVNGGSIVDVNGTVFFTANGANPSARDLWKTNGTTEETVLVKAGIAAKSLTNVSGMLYLSASSNGYGQELWKSDGTEAGTVRVKDISPGVNSANPESLTNVSGTLFFIASDGVHGAELWKSDGTEAGTVLVRDVVPGYSSISLPELQVLDGTLFIRAIDEIWKSDGTEAGTRLIANLGSGNENGIILSLITVGDGLFFKGKRVGSSVYTLWHATAAGNSAQDLGNLGLTDFELFSLPGKTDALYLRGTDFEAGSELRKLNFEQAFVLGDMDGDGDLDNFDIDDFELALTNPSGPNGYLTQHPTLTNYRERGDIDGDGDFDNFDIQPFEQLLTREAPAAGASALAEEPVTPTDESLVALTTQSSGLISASFPVDNSAASGTAARDVIFRGLASSGESNSDSSLFNWSRRVVRRAKVPLPSSTW